MRNYILEYRHLMLEFQGKLFFPWNTNIPGSILGIRSGTIGFLPANFTFLLRPEHTTGRDCKKDQTRDGERVLPEIALKWSEYHQFCCSTALKGAAQSHAIGRPEEQA
jgi:hypothetical protein